MNKLTDDEYEDAIVFAILSHRYGQLVVNVRLAVSHHDANRLDVLSAVILKVQSEPLFSVRCISI